MNIPIISYITYIPFISPLYPHYIPIMSPGLRMGFCCFQHHLDDLGVSFPLHGMFFEELHDALLGRRGKHVLQVNLWRIWVNPKGNWKNWKNWENDWVDRVDLWNMCGVSSSVAVEGKPWLCSEKGKRTSSKFQSHYCKRIEYLRPRSKGRKLAWQGALHENTMMLRMRMLPNFLPTVSPGGIEPWPNCWVVKYEVSCDWRFQPPNTLLKQEGLPLAEASFRDNFDI